MSDPVRLPLVPSLDQRSANISLDAKLVDGFLEKDQEGEFWVNKRPAFVPQFDDGPTNVGVAGGCFYWDFVSLLYYVVGNQLRARVIGSAFGVYTVVGTLTGVGPWWFNTTKGTPSYLYISNGINGYYVSSAAPATLNAITDAVYTGTIAGTVAGSAYLDGTTYVMDQKANIWGSKNLNDVTTWDALNVIVAQVEPDAGVAIAKQLIYVVAFKQWTTEFFYDAGQPVGSPLLPVQNAKIPMGTNSPFSIQSIDDVLYFQGISRESGTGIYVIAGLRLNKISTPAVDKYLEVYPVSGSWSLRVFGHTYYVAKTNSGSSLVYDITQGAWYFWNESIYATTVASNGPTIFMQASTTGSVFFYMSASVYFDQYSLGAGFTKVPITCDAVTPNFDAGVRTRKTLTKMHICADQNSGGTLQIRWTDDDYKTWTPWSSVNLQQEPPQFTNLGTFRRRAFQFRHASPTPFRMRAADLSLLLGTL